MMVLLLLAEAALAVFLLGVLVIAVRVAMKHGDRSASYKLYAIRDDLINACVFEGVSRNDPWLEALYSNVNSVLLHSNLLGGPQGWPLAVAVGQCQANSRDFAKKLIPLPENVEKCPAPIRALQPALQSALEHLSCHHLGLHLQMNAHEREQKRIQREKAKHLLEMIRGRDSGLSFA
jgi:hypothetical protein